MLYKFLSVFLLRRSYILITCCFIVLSGCGGDGSDTSNADEPPIILETLTGVAATGAPINMGKVTLKDKNGKIHDVTTDNFGVYSINLKNLSLDPPYLIKVVPAGNSDAETLYSVAEGPGVANITPFTDLALRVALDGSAPADFFEYGDIREAIYQSDITLDAKIKLSAIPFKFDFTPMSSLSEVRRNMGNKIVIESFEDDFSQEGVSVADLSLFSTPFVADGRGVDAVLDKYVLENYTHDDFTIRVTGRVSSTGQLKKTHNVLEEIEESLFKLPACRLSFVYYWKAPYCAPLVEPDRTQWVCDNIGSLYGGRGHTGLDIQTKDVAGLGDKELSDGNTHSFYAISEGIVVRAGAEGSSGNGYNIIAIYDDINDITSLYLHANKIEPEILAKAKANVAAEAKGNDQTERVSFGDLLGIQGDKGAPGKYHVHVSFRPGKVVNDLNVKDGINDTLDPIATYYNLYRSLVEQSKPSINSIGPSNPVAGKDGKQVFTISGSGFVDTTTVVLRDGDKKEYRCLDIVSRTLDTIELKVNFTNASDNWTVEVNNGSSRSNEFKFDVVESRTPWAPEGVTATPGNGKVVINWGEVGNASSYNIYFSTISGFGTAGTLISDVVPPYTHDKLTPGVEYFYMVVASNNLGDSSPSMEVSATPTDTSVGIQNLSGSVRDVSNRQGIPDARVKFELILNGVNSFIDTFSDEFGNFILSGDNRELPEHFLVTVSAAGYVPEAFDAARDTGAVTFELTRVSENVVVLEIDPALHHLGNDNFSGSTNSQFQKLSEGEFYEKSFNLSDRQMQADSIKLNLVVKGVDLADRVLINGLNVGVLIVSPSDGSFGIQELEVPVDAFVLGNNTIRIESVATFDLDDFEFTNVILYLSLP